MGSLKNMDLKEIIIGVASEALKKGNSVLANVLINNITRFNYRNVEIFLYEEVKEISKTSKEYGRDYIYIETDTAIWFELDKEVILEKINEGKSISCGFSRPIFPFDKKMKEMEEIGITTDISPYGFSSNLVGNRVILYHDYPLNDGYIPLALVIKNNLGKKISKILMSDLIYRKKNINSPYSYLIKRFMNKMSLLNHRKYAGLYKEILKLKCFKAEELIIFAIAITAKTIENNATIFSKNEIIKLTNLNEEFVDSYFIKLIINEYISQYSPGNNDLYVVKDIAKKQLIPRVVLSMLNNHTVKNYFPEINELLISHGLNLTIKPPRTIIKIPI